MICLIPEDIFFDNLVNVIHKPNENQNKIINAKPGESLFVVAGPGSGKTSVLTTRILKLIYVDGIDPASIIATTFTRKAAGELRSRILGRGFDLYDLLLQDSRLNNDCNEWLKKIDTNQIITGTIDSICEQALSEYREPGDTNPILVDEFISYTIMLRYGLFENGRFRNEDLYNFVEGIRGAWNLNIGTKVEVLKSIWDRRYTDQIWWSSFLNDNRNNDVDAKMIIAEALASYENTMLDRSMMDFTMLEQEFLNRLRDDKLKRFTDNINVLVVDEYQDTNLLQESIYFELVKKSAASLAVVGDDDQSLFRFRGATVELFSEFPDRFERTLGTKPKTVFLTTNYRSTKKIIDFVNCYASYDQAFQEVRVDQKPTIKPNDSSRKPKNELPVLGMFRPNLDTLARDLSNFIYNVFRDKGHQLPDESLITRDPDYGDLGDCALLCSSPLETKPSGELRLPGMLRSIFDQSSDQIRVFNPRGQDIADIQIVKEFAGLALRCLDPDLSVQNSIIGIGNVKDVLNNWRSAADDLLKGSFNLPGLVDYCEGWANRRPRKTRNKWPRVVHILDLLYGLRYWFPSLQKDPEGQIYLEVFTRQISSCETVGQFKANIIHDDKKQSLSKKSLEEVMRNIFIPIASGTIKVNEDLIETFPRDCLNVLSIHQAKGLEFPMVIVDVGSDFKSNHHSHAFKRFPKEGGPTQILEDIMRPHSPLGAPKRSGRDRAFDDLFRQFYVAYSRPEMILMLVGLETCLPRGNVQTITTGKDRTGKDCLNSELILYI